MIITFDIFGHDEDKTSKEIKNISDEEREKAYREIEKDNRLGLQVINIHGEIVDV